MEQNEIDQIRNECTRFLGGHGPLTPHQMLLELLEETTSEEKSDIYGQGALISNFEREIAALLGKEQAVFMPSGTMAQQIALRVWSDRKKSQLVAFHPKCHLQIHEQNGYQMLHPLHGILVGSPDQLITLDDLKRIAESPAAVLFELPQREIGGQLPKWEDLQAQVEWVRQSGAAVHMDGARLWECGPFYQRSYSEISSLFDTIYVSFYKILGGITGAALAGSADFIAEARIWQRRYGGNLVRMFPFILSARKGLRERLPKIPFYCQKAQEVARILADFPQIEISPNPPHTNMMHVFLRGDKERLEQAVLDVARQTKTWLFYPLMPTPAPSVQKFELTIGDGCLQIPNDEIRNLFYLLFEKAGV